MLRLASALTGLRRVRRFSSAFTELPVAEYRFLTTWLLEAQREQVWDAIYDSELWPEWWHGVESTERYADGDAQGLGQRGRYVWRAKLGYRVSSKWSRR